ncbi:LuxR C-terminal-related transcriptional regulator [Microvirga flavescens]|uniref:LuxR C-terminal-related transcriptional regulator n=1 Tax=Microvirga flavescens TaxID=2249811 RepID=UPI0018E078BA|nr:response regulator transcription factor [Microvirga flavescens]
MSATRFGDLQEALIPQSDNVLLVIGASVGSSDFAGAVQSFKQRRPGARAVVLVDAYDLKQVQTAFRAGVDAFLLKTISCEALIKTLDLVMLGESVYPAAILMLSREIATSQAALSAGTVDDHEERASEPEVSEVQSLAEKQQLERLSSRETVILRCLMDGESNKLIARKFDIAEATVKVHVKAILRKIRAKNRTQAAIWAVNHLRQQHTHA